MLGSGFRRAQQLVEGGNGSMHGSHGGRVLHIALAVLGGGEKYCLKPCPASSLAATFMSNF